MTLKDRVKQLAAERGISLPVLESELGFGNGTIVKWDKSRPNADKLNAVAKYFNVSMDYLMNGTSLDGLDEPERKLVMLCRNASESDPKKKAELVDTFESTIDIYKKAKGIK